MSLRRWLRELAGPIGLVIVVATIASVAASEGDDVKFRSAIVYVSMVVALYVFAGNSGVFSFGHVSFVAIGAFAAGVFSIPLDAKRGVLPTLFPLLREHTISNAWSLALAAGVGAVFAFLVGIPLMRLSGLAAGIATFAVLGITYNILTYWPRIGPGATTLTLIPETTGYLQATVGALAIVIIAYLYQESRWGRMLRATREDPVAARSAGIRIERQRLYAFTLSGALSGFAGGLYVHLLGSITTNQVYLDLTFLLLAMLVVGGIGSLWGAVVGAISVSFFTIVLQNSELGVHLGGLRIKLPAGSSLLGVAAAMVAVLLVRPAGITAGKEFALWSPPRLQRMMRRGRRNI